MSVTTAAPRPGATTATIALVAVPLRLVATGKTTPTTASSLKTDILDCRIHPHPCHKLLTPLFCSAPIKDDGGGSRDGEGAINSGSNLFVTGIHPKLSEDEVTRLFSKYGNVEKCQIMRDPHTKESRGFGFVNFMTSDEADAARDGLQGKELEGRTLSIEKARRSRPRTPTPGKYFGPPKRGTFGILSTCIIASFCSHYTRGRPASRSFRRRPIRRGQAWIRWRPRRSLRGPWLSWLPRSRRPRRLRPWLP